MGYPVLTILFLLWRSALQFVQKHVSILNDISLWADNWRDSVNCDKLKVLSNYTDSHRRVKVSASLWWATPTMKQPPIIESRLWTRGAISRDLTPLIVSGCTATCFIIQQQLPFLRKCFSCCFQCSLHWSDRQSASDIFIKKNVLIYIHNNA